MNEWLIKELQDIERLEKSNEYDCSTLCTLKICTIFEQSRLDGITYEKTKEELLKCKKWDLCLTK